MCKYNQLLGVLSWVYVSSSLNVKRLRKYREPRTVVIYHQLSIKICKAPLHSSDLALVLKLLQSCIEMRPPIK